MAWLLPTIAIAATMAYICFVNAQRRADSLSARLDQIVPIGSQAELSCADLAASHPLVLLALGQSNAGNHGSPSAYAGDPVTLIAGQKCIKATDPLPGATGLGGSIWRRLPALLAAQRFGRTIVLSVLAVDATTIDDWTSQHSPLRKRLSAQVESMQRLGLAPDFVLWQQGESDAKLGTDSVDYLSGLHRLAANLEKANSQAPILLARSTTCRSSPGTKVLAATNAIASNDGTGRFRSGPDTDTLQGPKYRHDDCHFNAEGLESAARMWAAHIAGEANGGIE